MIVRLNHHLDFVIKVAIITKKPLGAEPSAAVHAAAGGALLSLSADVSSTAASHSSATLVNVGARGDTPREVDPSLVVDYECESDEMVDSQRLIFRLCPKRRLLKGAN